MYTAEQRSLIPLKVCSRSRHLDAHTVNSRPSTPDNTQYAPWHSACRCGTLSYQRHGEGDSSTEHQKARVCSPAVAVEAVVGDSLSEPLPGSLIAFVAIAYEACTAAAVAVALAEHSMHSVELELAAVASVSAA